jgi:hypothetical protein
MSAQTQAERPATYPEAHARQPQGTDPDFERLLKQVSFGTRDMLTGDTFDKVHRLAEVMASGRSTIPKHLQGNVGDCAAIIGQAMRWGMDHIAVAQKTHIVNGTLGYEAQLVVAVLNNSPLLSSRINYTWSDGWDGSKGKEDNSKEHWCEVSATLRGEDKPRVLRITMAQVGGVRNSPNWGTDARQQLAYLGAKRWGRLHAPDVLLGVYTPDELQWGREDDALDEHQPRPPAAPAPAALPACRQEDLDRDIPKMQKVIDSGKKTAEQLLATMSTKATFTEAQKAQILALKPTVQAPPPPAPPAVDDPAPLTYARLVDAINACTERQAAELILDEGAHLPEDQQEDLAAALQRKFGSAA